MQGQRNIVSVAQLIMSELTPLVDAQHGGFFMIGAPRRTNEPMLNLIASYGFTSRKNLSNTYKLKESLVGQCAFEKKRILLTDVPEDFIHIQTGLRRSASAQRRRAARSLRRRDEGGHRAGVVQDASARTS